MIEGNSSTSCTEVSEDRDSPVAINLSSVTKDFGQVRALGGISLSVRGGEIYGLLGPNGAGKSTTINIICGLLRPDSGSVHVNGLDAVSNSRAAKQAIGIVPQELALYTELTARQNLSFFGRLFGLRGAGLKARIGQLLDMVHLTGRADEPVGVFSGGMQRRLNIAAGLMQNPSVVLMDEPTVGLDPQNRTNILEIVQEIAAAGAAVLYSTHYMDEVERICNRIGVIDHGVLLAEGALEELRTKEGGRQILTLRGAFDANKVSAAIILRAGEKVVKYSADEIVMDVADADGRLTAILAAASQAGNVREVFMNRQSLESLFIQLTGRELRE